MDSGIETMEVDDPEPKRKRVIFCDLLFLFFCLQIWSQETWKLTANFLSVALFYLLCYRRQISRGNFCESPVPYVVTVGSPCKDKIHVPMPVRRIEDLMFGSYFQDLWHTSLSHLAVDFCGSHF